MISSTYQIQILYEIALSLGEGSSLREASAKSLSTYLRKLNGSAGAIFQKHEGGETYWYQKIATIPKRIEKNELFRKAAEAIPEEPTRQENRSGVEDYPVIRHHDGEGHTYLMKLEGFGLLLLVKKGEPLPEDFIYSLRPLNQKLADSLNSFADREQLYMQSQALESNSNAIIITDNKGRIEWVNQAWCDLNQYNQGEVIGKKPSILKSGQHDRKFYKNLWGTILSGKSWSNTLINRKKSGDTYYFEYSINPVFDSQGEIINFIGTGQDVTPRVKAQEELRESKERFEDMADLLPQPIWETDSNGWFIYTNKTGYEVMGYTPEDLKKGVLFTELIQKENRESIVVKFKKMKEGFTGTAEGTEYTCLRKDGSTFPALIFTSPVHKQGIFSGVRGITLDISDLKETQKELMRAKEKAEVAEQAQFNFLSTMSHEIRTPLNAVVGLTNILLMEYPRDDQRDSLNTLKFSSQNLLNIINNILDYNKLHSNNVVLEEEDFNLPEILKGMHFAMSSLAREKGICLSYEIEDTIPEVLVGDSTRLQQIINNLVSNSIKFTKEGEITVKVRKVSKTNKKVVLHFSVKDTGIGIPADKIESIFEEFRQTSTSITREYGGTGLGLPIVKRLIQLMGSDINVDSEPGKGSNFTFELTFRIGRVSAQEESKKPVHFDDSLKNKRILLVEDDRINQIVARKFLEDWKCVIETAQNGKIALYKVKENQYDAVLMDLHMPVMDGYETTRRIREMDEKQKSNIPIIALSASALGEIETRTKKFGMNDFVTKPFEPELLFKALQTHTKEINY